MRPLVIALLLTLLAIPAKAASVRNLAAVAHDGRVGVSFELVGGFDVPDIARAVRSGVPTGFTYQVQLIRKRPNWFDTHIADARIDVVVSYNSVTGQYLLNYRRNRRLVRSETLTDIAELERRMTRIDEPELFPLEDYRPYKLRVRARAEIIRDWFLYLVPRPIRTEWETARVESEPGS